MGVFLFFLMVIFSKNKFFSTFFESFNFVFKFLVRLQNDANNFIITIKNFIGFILIHFES